MEWLDALSLDLLRSRDPCLELGLLLLCFFEAPEEWWWLLSSDRLCLEDDLDSHGGVLSVELLADLSLFLLSFSSEVLLELLVGFLRGSFGEVSTSWTFEGVTIWWRYLAGGRANMPSNSGFGCRVS